MKTVETVLGSIAPEKLGRTLMHEHLVFGFPGYSGDFTRVPFKREEAIKEGVKLVEELNHKYGVQTVVEATPNDCGRDVGVLKEISELSKVNIVATSSYYYEGEGAGTYLKFLNALGSDVGSNLYDMFKKEAIEGVEGTGVKVGAFKLATSRDAITPYEKMFFAPVAKVAKEHDLPIITHTQEGKQGVEQAEVLISECGVKPGRIMVGHIGGSTDMNYLLSILEKGAYIGYDRLGIQGLVGCPDESRTIACIIGLIGAGYVNRIMLSHDYVHYWKGAPLVFKGDLAKLMENWHPSHLFKNIIPALKRGGVTDAQIDTILIENPRSFFTGE